MVKFYPYKEKNSTKKTKQENKIQEHNNNKNQKYNYVQLKTLYNSQIGTKQINSSGTAC